MGDKTKGIYEKFSVTRTDGKSEPGEKHENCRYFVVDLDHDEFAAETIKKYAELCRGEYPVLADDLIQISSEIMISKTSLFSD